MIQMIFNEKNDLFKEKTGNTFNYFYIKYYPKLNYFINKICNDTQLSEDLTTNSFLMAYEKIDSYDSEKAQFSTWLFIIAKNLTLQEIKKNKKTVSIDIEVDEDGTTLKDFLVYDDSEELNQKHDILLKKANIILKYIPTLKEPYREVIEMREIKKMSYKDIADKLGKNLSTIKSQIRNGRAILINQTEEEFKVIEKMYS
jgi:RNA polymerase sigma-70 factor, ECF subfamily